MLRRRRPPPLHQLKAQSRGQAVVRKAAAGAAAPRVQAEHEAPVPDADEVLDGAVLRAAAAIVVVNAVLVLTQQAPLGAGMPRSPRSS